MEKGDNFNSGFTLHPDEIRANDTDAVGFDDALPAQLLQHA